MPSTDPEPGASGQWVQAQLLGASVPAECRISLGEGSTPLQAAPELGQALGAPRLWLKREDLNPTGSHKARGMGWLCSQLLAEGRHQAVISSSGNAAIAAAAYASRGGIRLLSLLSPETPGAKLRRLLAQPQLAVLSRHPVELLHHAVAKWGLADLRGSVHPLAALPYRGIAAELVGEMRFDAVFLFCSSGATALGLSQGMEALVEPDRRPRLELVEGHPGGELTRPWYPREEGSGDLARGIFELGTRRSRLAPAVRRAARESGGRGWRVDPGRLPELRELAERRGVSTSWEGLAALAAVADAARSGVPAGNWVAILTGASWQLDLSPLEEPLAGLQSAGDETQLDDILARAGFTRGEGG